MIVELFFSDDLSTEFLFEKIFWYFVLILSARTGSCVLIFATRVVTSGVSLSDRMKVLTGSRK